MKSIEINDLLSYHFYGNLKVKDGVKVFVDGVAAEKENAYEYTLKCVKDDKVYDLTSYGKESGFYIENENSILFCGNRKNIEKSTSLYRLSLNGGEAKEIARFYAENPEDVKFLAFLHRAPKEATVMPNPAFQRTAFGGR